MYRKGRVYRRGKIWYIDFFADGRRIREAAGENKRFAETALSKRLTEVAEGSFLNIKKDEKIKFEVFAQEYLEVHAKNKRSYHSDVDRIKTLNRFFGNKFLHEITPFAVEKFKTERAKEVSGATVNRDMACLKCLFNKAIAWSRYSGKNPVKGIKLFKEQPRLRFLEKEEIFKLLANCDEHLKPIVIAALHTGMRKGEILNLKWHDIDFKRDIAYLYQTKNGERREIRINNEVKAIGNVKMRKGVSKNVGDPIFEHEIEGLEGVSLPEKEFQRIEVSEPPVLIRQLLFSKDLLYK